MESDVTCKFPCKHNEKVSMQIKYSHKIVVLPKNASANLSFGIIMCVGRNLYKLSSQKES